MFEIRRHDTYVYNYVQALKIATAKIEPKIDKFNRKLEAQIAFTFWASDDRQTGRTRVYSEANAYFFIHNRPIYTMKLYAVSDGPPSLAVRMTLKALDIQYQLINVDFCAMEHRTDEYAKVRAPLL